jgi:hypothetical protein
MAIPRLSVKPRLSKGKGRSCVGRAAYNSRQWLIDQQTGRGYNFSRKHEDVLFSGIYLPTGAAAIYNDRATLWNAVLERERYPTAQTALPIEFALPHELTLEQNRRLLQDWTRENVTRRGYAADVAIHAPDKGGDQRNIHAHMLVTVRRFDASTKDGWAKAKERPWTTPKERDAFYVGELERFRASWERLANRHLERAGKSERIGMKTLEAQGIKREPTRHMGVAATAMERKGQQPERAQRQRADRQHRTTSRAALALLMRELQELQRMQEQGATRPEQDAAQPVSHADDQARQREAEAAKAREREAAFYQAMAEQQNLEQDNGLRR